MSVTLTILGCASSGGVPRAGGSTLKDRWGACDPKNPKNVRKRCSALLTRQSDAGATHVVIDTGPDFRTQMLDADVPHLDGVLYTHEHADHLHGIDDMRPFALIQRKRIPVYMSDQTFNRATDAFGYVFETPVGSSYPPILDRMPLDELREVEIIGDGGNLSFLPIPVIHGDITALGFRIKKTVYLPDVSAVEQASMPHFEGLDTLIIDCLRDRPHPSHFNVEGALRFIEDAKPKRAILTNLHNDLDYAELASRVPSHVEPAYDGMTVQVG